MSRPGHKALARFLQWGISIAALAYIFWRLMQFKDWELFFDTLYHQRWQLTGLLLIQLIFSAVNIGLESAKWRQLSGAIIRQSWHNTFYQVVKGIQTAMITPARTGEPVVRGLLLPLGLRTKGFLLSATGSVIQNMVLMIGGMAGIMLTQNHATGSNTTFGHLQKGIVDYSLITLLAVAVITLIVYALIKTFNTRALIKQLTAHLRAIAQLGINRLLKVAGLTLARYAVYNFQLWLMLWFFDVSTSLSDLGLIMTYYAAITLLPTMAVADLGIRSSIALFLFGMLSPNSAGIVASVFFIWMINLALPSIVAATLQPREDIQ
ncbi:MAG: flippase-like domain-containing protein [Bacteroidales bacterium]|nr:flippase-like domain-containing protein [Bacteroidales bacterium]